MQPSALSTAQKRLTAAQARKRRAALGPPLDVDIEQASRVSAADQPEVLAFVRSCAGQKGADLIEAGT